MPNNPLTSAELQAYSINPTGIPQMPAGYFLASPVSGTGPFAYRLFDASYISIGIIDPNRLGTGSTGAGTRYLADDGTWKLVSSISVPTPTLHQVTTAGYTTTNPIIAGQYQIYGTTRNARLSSDNVGGFDINYNIGGTPDWRWFGGGTTALTTFKANGNVLIGTTTDAGYKLDVAGNTRVNGGDTTSDIPFIVNNRFQFRGDGVLSYGAASAHGRLNWDASGAYFYGLSGYGVGLGANGVLNHLFITTSGNVGIGTTSPTYKIDVQGTTLVGSTISAQGGFNISRVAAPSGTITLTASSGGSVDVGQHQYFITYTTAIGETTKGSNANITVVSGSQTVTITGIPVSTDPRVTGRKIYRTRAGQTADRGALLATIADNTTTSYVDTVADSTLANIGDWASYRENTTSRYIMVDGSRAMLLGSQVTILGIGAGAALTEAGLGVLIGTNAGQSLTSGFSSTFIGHSAGRAVTTGQNNISIGPQSTWNTTTGNGNIVIGPGGLFFNTTGGDNIAIGSYTLEGSSGNSHSFNVAIGPAALYKLGAANNNVAIGYHSGRYISNGSNNTLSSNSVFIGYDTRPNADSETNQIVIGYNGRGLGSNTTVIGNSSTTFTSIPAGNMTIGGTTNAGYKLDVQGTTRILGTLEIGSNTAVQGGLSIFQKYAGNNIIGSISTEYAQGAMILGYGAIGKSGSAGFVSSYDNFSGYKTALRIGSQGTLSFFSSITTNLTPVGSDLSLTEVFKIDNTGYVGIGTTNPTKSLTVNGDISIPNNAAYCTKNTSGSELAVFKADTSNNVQIGSIYFGGALINYTSTLFDWYQYPSSVLTHRMRLASNGNLLVGTSTDAGYKLDVNGTFRAVGASYLNSTLAVTGVSTFSSAATFNATATFTSINAKSYNQITDGVPVNNLGNPTVTEMALFDEQFDNKTAFYPTIYGSSILTFETYDGTTWTDISSTLTDTQKKQLFGGDNSSSIVIPYGTVQYRITINNPGPYVFANALYCYWSGNGHSTQVHIWKKHNSGSWTQHTSSTTQVSSWPGHLYLPFAEIPWHPSGTLGVHYHQIRVVFIPTWNATFPTNNINLYKTQWWGGYPAGKRVLYSTDENKNVIFPANITANGTLTATGAFTANSTSNLTQLATFGNSASFDNAGGGSAITFKQAGTNRGILGIDAAIYGVSTSNIGLYVYGSNDLELSTNNNKRLIIKGGGNILIGTTTDSGYKVDVVGTGRFSVDNLTTTAPGTGFTLANNTAATASVTQQNSPSLFFTGSAWVSGALKTHDIAIQSQPQTWDSTRMIWSKRLNGGSWLPFFGLRSDGTGQNSLFLYPVGYLKDGIGQAHSGGFTVSNGSQATAVLQQYSPAFMVQSWGWNGTSNSLLSSSWLLAPEAGTTNYQGVSKFVYNESLSNELVRFEFGERLGMWVNKLSLANYTTTINSYTTLTGSVTASSNVARGIYLNQTLVAAANNDTLVGLDIAPTFTTGAFTGVSSASLRVNSAILCTNTPSIGSAGAPFGTMFISNVRSAVDLSLGAGYGTSGDNALRIFSSTKNILIQNGGTYTDAGYRLDVNGTARVQSSLTVTSLTTDGPVVSNSGVLNSVAGYTGMVTIQQPAPLPPVTFDIQNGIIVNVL